MAAYKSITTLLIGLCSAVLIACGGGGGGGGIEGRFLDSAVEGVSYVAGSRSGTTSATGGFRYNEGSRVFFSIGGIELGDGLARKDFTPLTLIGTSDLTHPTVINVARFLQTLDDDGIPENGIRITQAIRELAAAETLPFSKFEQSLTDFGNDPDIEALIQRLTGNVNSLVTSGDAEEHLRETLEGILVGARGSFDGSINFITTNCDDPDFNINETFKGSITIETVSITDGGATFTGSGRFDFSAGRNTLSIILNFTGSSNTIDFDGAINTSGVFALALNNESLFRTAFNHTGMYDDDNILLTVAGASDINVGGINCSIPNTSYVFTR